ncbi:MAG: endolytic transglycosylase MltG [Bacteroidota bacterium]
MIRKLFTLLLLVGLGLLGFLYYQIMVVPVVPEDSTSPVTVTVPSGADYEQVMDTLAAAGITPNRHFFDPLAERMAYKRPEMRAGRFAIEPGISALELIRQLRGGDKLTVEVVLTTEREPENVAAKVARFLEADSLDFVQLFQDESYLIELGYTKETLMTLFIPNTYELYWDASPEQFMERMVKEHDRFWSSEGRREKAKAQGLSRAEAYTLASIVYSESLAASEQARIAGLYLNRLQQGVLLQSDPTAVFANRVFGVRRVLYKHIELDHPYNTYVHKGLPPGPITMPSMSSIEAVLNPEDHEYIFMCAKGDNSGLHNFAKTAAGHSRNKAVYVANLKARGLR